MTSSTHSLIVATSVVDSPEFTAKGVAASNCSHSPARGGVLSVVRCQAGGNLWSLPDPLLCHCGHQMRVISFLTDPPVVDRILKHLELKEPGSQRGPPSDHEDHQLAT